MLRLGAIFVAVCMVLIAASAGAILFLWFGLSGIESGLGALALFTALVVINTVSTRLRDRSDFGGHIADLSRGTADLARQVAEFGRRMSAMETLTNAAIDKAVAVTRPLSTEIGELGTLVTQLAETVAAHESTLAELRPQKAAAPAPISESEIIPEAPPAANDGAVTPAKTAPRFQDMTQDAVIALLREAIDANRIDLHLQPIVTLPQRKVRYYEAMARLRTADGEQLLPSDFLPYAEAGGLMPRIDNAILFRCVQVLRRLLAKNREVGLFCNVSTATLGDPAMFPQVIEFLDANRTLASSLMLELRQAAYRSLGPIETESMGALWDRGFRFSMDNVGDLRVEPRDLSERGFRFIKVPAKLLLERNDGHGDIHAADFAGLLSRFGIEMVAEKIESEGLVVDLLDYEVKFGQGFLFSPPRPVRPEVMQGIADRQDVAVRVSQASADTPRPAPEQRTAAGRASALAQLARGVVARG
jgi:cyclic-di-GMP phosphodiesterase, flagellum assembly factor TipF